MSQQCHDYIMPWSRLHAGSHPNGTSHVYHNIKSYVTISMSDHNLIGHLNGLIFSFTSYVLQALYRSWVSHMLDPCQVQSMRWCFFSLYTCHCMEWLSWNLPKLFCLLGLLLYWSRESAKTLYTRRKCMIFCLLTTVTEAVMHTIILECAEI